MAEEACGQCHGSGKLGRFILCPTCKGRGIIVVNRRSTGSASKSPKKKKGWGW